MLLKVIRNPNRRTNLVFLPSVRKYFSTSSRAGVDVASKDGEMRIFLVAGEVSGDAIGSRLIAALKKLSPYPIRIAGVGGSMMAKNGLKSLFPMEDIAVMGILELLPHLNKFQVRLKQTFEAAVSFRPHVVVTIDSKGFSFRLLKQLRARFGRQGPSAPLHFHYVAPSFWAWKGGEARLKGLSEFVDHVLCILPFEENVCKSHGVAATFVGHPVLEDMLELNSGKATTEKGWEVQGNADVFRSKYGISSGSTILSLLPGSRIQEVTRMLPIYLKTMNLLKGYVEDLTTVIHVAPNQHVQDYIKRAINEWSTSVVLVPGGSPCTKYDAFSASRVALCTSGTVAMELQLARLPCVVAYRAHFLTEWVIRYKAKIPYISLPNILLGSSVIPEVLFRDCTPTKLASLLRKLMNNEGVQVEQIVAAEKVMELLSPPPRARLVGCNLDHEESSSYNTPSLLAAWTVLYHRGRKL
ncbi:probable lipid-A-disaccharide synthase, mitochondrial [Cynara cardunculus var. scolymus]|uniref:probable lipid-A-disaccharide synthase, mitochondrial n=1 Tax=Cynara cardunculus var. scolymus TaxID=59895 RepID=UPI000D623EF8|nr:probable lipid-A-disaccharide synthase, mitochondrial [Cynara cardunculus var. scolymus]